MTQRCVILHNLCTPSNTQTQVMIDCGIFKKKFIPVISRIHPRRETITTRVIDTLCRIFWLCQRITGLQSFVVSSHISNGIYNIDFLRWHRSNSLITESRINRSFSSFLCRNQNYPVGSSSTIHGRGRSILQHAERINIFRINTRQVKYRNLHSIQQNQRSRISIITERSNTTDRELSLHFLFSQRPRHSPFQVTDHTRNTSHETCSKITIGGFQ